MSFSSLITEDLSTNDGPRFKLVEDLVWFRPSGALVIPAGFVTDFASIPRYLWPILPPVGAYDRAAVVHDYYYRFNGCPRVFADQLLEEGMTELDVTPWKSVLIYRGVRLGGIFPWRKYRKAEQNAH